MTSPSTAPLPPKLKSTEWILTGTLLLILVSLVVIAKIQARRFSIETQILPPPVQISIEGQVSKPGSYQIPAGTPLADVLRKARPKRLADLSSLDLSARIKEPMRLEIKSLTKISIFVEGAVEQPGPLKVPVNTRICQLKKYVTLSPEADLAFFKKRRLLKEGETVVIPLRK